MFEVIDVRKSIKIKSDILNFKFRVSGIIIKNNKILFVDMDDSGFLCLPGGYVELGETTEEACLRELKEEIGINFKIDKYCGVIENFYKNKFNNKVHEIALYYFLTPIDKINNNDFTVVENDKGRNIKLNFKWINIDDIDKYDIRPQSLKTNFCFNHLIINELEK